MLYILKESNFELGNSEIIVKVPIICIKIVKRINQALDIIQKYLKNKIRKFRINSVQKLQKNFNVKK